jgi:hypothetical protein
MLRSPTRSGAFLGALLGLGLLLTGCTSGTSAEGLMTQAEAAQEATSFTQAAALYEQAQAAFVASGDEAAAAACVEALQDLEITMVTYPYTAADMLTELEKAFPQVPAEDRAAWLDQPGIEKSVYDGAPHYFQSLPENIAYRDVALFRSLPAKMEGPRTAYRTMLPYIQAAASADPTRPYAAPSSYTFTQTLVVPRSELPATSLFRTWFPLPIEGGPQTNVKILSITPTTYLTFPSSTSEDIGLLYMEVPLDTLATDLNIQVTFSFDHSPQYFKVEPDRIGPYDTQSAVYKQYTATTLP